MILQHKNEKKKVYFIPVSYPQAYKTALKQNYFYDLSGEETDRQNIWSEIIRAALDNGSAVIFGSPLTDKIDPKCEVMRVGYLNTVPTALAMRKVSQGGLEKGGSYMG